MDVVVLEELALLHSLGVNEYVLVLVAQHDKEPWGSGCYDSVHYDDVWLHDIVCHLGRASVHEEGSDQNDEGPRHEEADILVWKLSFLVDLVHFEDDEDFCVREPWKLWVLRYEFLNVSMSYGLQHVSLILVVDHLLFSLVLIRVVVLFVLRQKGGSLQQNVVFWILLLKSFYLVLIMGALLLLLLLDFLSYLWHFVCFMYSCKWVFSLQCLTLVVLS